MQSRAARAAAGSQFQHRLAPLSTGPSSIRLGCTDKQVPRSVRLGIADVYWPWATHWAVQVDDSWFEVAGASKGDSAEAMTILTSQGTKSGKGANVSRFGHVGATHKSNHEIAEFIRQWQARNPRYTFTRDNCQKFAREFIGWLTEGRHKPLPMMDAGEGAARVRGPTTWAGADDGTAYAGAMVATAQGSRGLWNGSIVGLRASATALCGRHGFGIFGEAELGRAEGGIGPVRVAIHLNANTGVGLRGGGMEVSLLGFGFTAGMNGVSASLPFCTLGVGRALGPNG